MKGLIEEIRKLGNIILVIDEVHNIVGAGDAEGSMNAANILKPALSRGRDSGHRRHHLQRVPQAYREGHRARAPLPARHGERAVHGGHASKILKGIAHYYEQFHGVKIPDGMLRQAVHALRAVYHRPLPAG